MEPLVLHWSTTPTWWPHDTERHSSIRTINVDAVSTKFQPCLTYNLPPDCYMLVAVVLKANARNSNRYFPIYYPPFVATSSPYMKNFERTGGQTAYLSAGTNQCWSVQTSVGVRKMMYLLRTRQLIPCASCHICDWPLRVDITLTDSEVGKWRPLSFQACIPSPEMMNTIHTVWTGKRLVTRAPFGDERTNTENSDLMRYVARSVPPYWKHGWQGAKPDPQMMIAIPWKFTFSPSRASTDVSLAMKRRRRL